MTPLDALARFPLRRVDVAGGAVAWREAGTGAQVTHVLLHGIGSSSANWVFQLAAADGAAQRVLAWDAPGYGGSSALGPDAPFAADYAARMWAWLDAMGVQTPVTLAGHSLGALMAGAAAVQAPTRVSRLVLLAPARGYGASSADERESKLHQRLDKLRRLGPAGVAADRAASMLSPTAAPALVDAVREAMAAIDPAGYTQAARMLSQGDLCADLAQVRCPVWVASGAADTITPPAACQSVAAAAGVPWNDLGAVGHACTLEAPEPTNQGLGL